MAPGPLLARFESRFDAIPGLLLRSVQDFRVHTNALKGRLALADAAAASDPTQRTRALAVAQRMVDRLDEDYSRYRASRVWGLLIRAGISLQSRPFVGSMSTIVYVAPGWSDSNT